MKEINIKAVEKALMKELKGLKTSKCIIINKLLSENGLINNSSDLFCDNRVMEEKIHRPLIDFFNKIKSSDKYSKVTLRIQSDGDGRKKLYSVMFIAKPCREFLRLAKKFENVTGRILFFDDVKEERLFGKRNNYSVENTIYLCHNAKSCLENLKKLTGYKGNKDNVKIKKITGWMMEKDIMEIEWNGSCLYWVDIVVKTPTGRVKADFSICLD